MASIRTEATLASAQRPKASELSEQGPGGGGRGEGECSTPEGIGAIGTPP